MKTYRCEKPSQSSPNIDAIVVNFDSISRSQVNYRLQKVRRSKRIAEKRKKDPTNIIVDTARPSTSMPYPARKVQFRRGTKRKTAIDESHEIQHEFEDQFGSFEQDPYAALRSLAINSGQNRFSFSSSLFRKIASNNDVTDIPIDLLNNEKLEAEIDTEADTQNVARVFQRFQFSFSKRSSLLSCASCGIRNFTMGNETFHSVDLLSLIHI